MARLIEIAGLGDAVKSMRKEIASIKSVAKDINTEAPMLLAEMTDIRDQIREHRADIKADAASLPNSGGQSDEPQDSQKQPVVSQSAGTVPLQPEDANAAQGSIVGAGTASLGPPLTFRAEAEQQIAAALQEQAGGHKP
jgi:hypothetical protein